MTKFVITESTSPEMDASIFPVMVQLRPHLEFESFIADLAEVRREGGRMIGALDGETCLGCAVFRPQFRLALGHIVYVDDLVTDETRRSSGVGKALIAHIEEEAKRVGATWVILDSGVQRERAHRFYFREGFSITSFNFKKPL